jgi:hypothetical protein
MIQGSVLPRRWERGGSVSGKRSFGTAGIWRKLLAILFRRLNEQAAVYANRQRIGGNRGKQLLRRRGELIERTFAHAHKTGALRRLYVRGKQNVQKRLLLQAAACNLALLLRTMIGAGTPRALHDAVANLLRTP